MLHGTAHREEAQPRSMVRAKLRHEVPGGIVGGAQCGKRILQSSSRATQELALHVCD
jgi:hypothetical protein